MQSTNKRQRIPKEHKLPCIYKATSKTTGICYIGQTVRGLHIRKRQHLIDTKNHEHECDFHRAIRDLGENDFEWEIVFSIDSPKLSRKEIVSILNQKELELVPGRIELNERAGGGNYVRLDLSHLTAEQLKERRLKAHRKVMTQRRKTIEYQKRQEEHRNKSENKLKHKEMMKERSQTTEYKKKHRISVEKYQSKPEVKAKRKALYATPEYIEKHRIAQRKYLAKKKALKLLNNTNNIGEDNAK